MYGIPNMKLEKQFVTRRVKLMEEEGVTFVTGVDVGKSHDAKKILADYDAVVLCTGAKNPRDLNVPGRDASGIHFAVDFLGATTRSLLDSKLKDGAYISAADKDVVIIGGGDTGNDCVGTSIRHGCKSVVQLEMMPKLPDARSGNNVWPQWPRISKTDYGQEEAIAVFGSDPRRYQTTVKELVKNEEGNLIAIRTIKLESKLDKKSGRMSMVEVAGTEEELPCQLLLIAAGFLGTQNYLSNAFGLELDGRQNIANFGNYQTAVDKLFVAGDARRGQSLVVWAIAEGRGVARSVDEYLMGYSNL